MTSEYPGTELDLFANANNWKSYWSKMIRPYLGSRILDVGAGIGGTAKLFRGLSCERYLALEPDSGFVGRMQSDELKGELPESFEARVGTTRELDPDLMFDTILYIDVLEHIVDDIQELERAAGHLLEGGRIIVLSPAHPGLTSAFDVAVGHVRRYNQATLAAARPSGLVDEKIFYLDSVGLLASLGNRLILRKAEPSRGEIRIWDKGMIPLSRLIDRIASYNIGKTVVAVFRKPAPSTAPD